MKSLGSVYMQAGERLYYYTVPSDATTVSIARLLPSGNYYNEKVYSIKLPADSKGLIFSNGKLKVVAYTYGD